MFLRFMSVVMVAKYLRHNPWHALRIYSILTRLGSPPSKKPYGGTVMPRWPLEDDYWSLVHQLMIHGWYRFGQGPADDHGRSQWGFQEGHLRDIPASPPLWIPADDEHTAMRILLREVKRAVDERASRSTFTAGASPSAPHIPDGGGGAPQVLAAP
jgi:hypothetical protein